MSKLEANLDDLKQAKNTLSVNNNELEALKGDLEVMLDMINAEWKGLAAETYKFRIRRYINDINSIQKSIKELKDYTEEVKSQMEFHDSLRNVFNFLPFLNL